MSHRICNCYGLSLAEYTSEIRSVQELHSRSKKYAKIVFNIICVWPTIQYQIMHGINHFNTQ
jgi:hypothetical protein